MTSEENIRRLAMKAIFTTDLLLKRIVLKGGNALDIVYNLSGRVSIDLDFSLADDFSEQELPIMKTAIEKSLEKTFDPEGLKTFDVKLVKKPQEDRTGRDSFWGGYNVTFKVTDLQHYEKNKGDIQKLSREAKTVASRQRRIFSIDISKYEYCEGKIQKTYDGYTIYVYSLEMIVFEKLRAICQQMEEYQSIIEKSRTPRARDFYDIYVIQSSSDLDLYSAANIELLKHIFECKKVPLPFLKLIKNSYGFHINDYNQLKDTVKVSEQLKPFDFYFDYVVNLVDKIPIN
jgi:predicted nucleotidyltransferase component of viral defense system